MIGTEGRDRGETGEGETVDTSEQACSDIKADIIIFECVRHGSIFSRLNHHACVIGVTFGSSGSA